MTTSGAEPPPADELSTSEWAELARLRSEVTRLRAQTAHPGRGARFGRWTGAIVLLVVAGLLFGASVLVVFARTQLLNTDRYVETISPLARDPVIQDAITARLTEEVMTKADVAGLTKQLAEALEARGAPTVLNNLVAPITSGVQSFLSSEIRKVVASETFAQVWDSANRVAHDEVDALLTTGQGKILSAQGTEVSINLGAILTVVKQKLVDAGFGVAAKIPDTAITVPLFHADNLPKVRTAVSWLNTAAWLLPLLALILLGFGIWVAPNRRRGLLIGAATFAVVLAILLGLLAGVRTYYLNRLPDTIKSPQAVEIIYDTETRFLVKAIQTLIVLFAIVVVLCWVTGTSRLAVLIRRGINHLLDAAGHGLARTGLPLGPVPAFLHQQRRAIIVGATILALAILVLWRTPGIAGVVWLTVGVLVFLALVEIVARAARSSGAAPVPSPAG